MNSVDDFLKEVNRFKIEFIQSTGLQPKKLYLGELQFHYLVEFAFEAGYIDDRRLLYVPYNELQRPELYGLKVYKVDSYSFLRCGV